MSAPAVRKFSLAANLGRYASLKSLRTDPVIITRRLKDISCSAKLPQIVVLLTFLVSLTMANENAKAVAKGNNDFTNKLYDQLSQKAGNVFFSPVSCHTVLSLVHQGAEGVTEEVLRTTLAIPDKARSADGFSQVMSLLNNVENVTLSMANKVYVMENYNLKQSFKDVAVKSFFAEAVNVNFAQNVEAAKSINDWVEEKTKNKIKDLIQPSDLDSLTRLVLVNAIYFKGNWLDKFEERATTDDKFYINAEDTVPCRMMHATRKYEYAESEELDAQILRLPYKNQDISMVIVLPKKRDGIAALEQKLKNFDLTKITEHVHSQEVVLSIPKFKIEVTMQLNDPLAKMGLENIFSGAANFSGLLDSKEELYVSKVVQKAFIEVNEEGAEAAAATGWTLHEAILIIPIRKPPVMKADHPFVFIIMGPSETIHFHGKLVKP